MTVLDFIQKLITMCANFRLLMLLQIHISFISFIRFFICYLISWGLNILMMKNVMLLVFVQLYRPLHSSRLSCRKQHQHQEKIHQAAPPLWTQCSCCTPYRGKLASVRVTNVFVSYIYGLLTHLVWFDQRNKMGYASHISNTRFATQT